MVMLQTCEICNNENVQDNLVFIHPIRYYFTCYLCKNYIKNIIVHDEIKNGIYKDFIIIGDNIIYIEEFDILIKGTIKCFFNNYIIFKNLDLDCNIEFIYNNQSYQKLLNIKDLKKNNNNFPIIKIKDNVSSHSANKELIKINKNLRKVCLLNNKKIRIILIGKKNKNCLFNKLPNDLLKDIINKYFTSYQ